MNGLHTPSYLMDHLEPRPPPRLAQVPIPTPFNVMTIPRPTVPDVSLLFDSSGYKSGHGSTVGHETPPTYGNSTSAGNYNLANKRNGNLQSYPESLPKNTSVDLRSNHSKVQDINDWEPRSSNSSRQGPTTSEYSNNSDLKLLISMIKKQEDCMARMENQIKDLVDFQNNFLTNLIKRGSSLHKEVQTEDQHCGSRNSDSGRDRNSFSGSSSCSSESFQSLPKQNSTHTQKPLAESMPKHNEEAHFSKLNTKQNPTPIGSSKSSVRSNTNGELRRPESAESNRSNGREKTEDLSAILRDLQLPSVQEASMYSDTSMRLLDLQEYHDDSINSNNGVGSPQIGPSVSAYGSCSSDEENSPPAVKPTVTFYRNVLGNVNRLLENDGNQEARQNVRQSTSYNRSSPRQLRRPGAARKDLANFTPTSRSSGTSHSSSDSGRDNSTSVDTSIPYRGRQHEAEKGNDHAEDVGDATKRYLETLGVQFTPTNEKKQPSHNPSGSKANVMIQQNVYNSIYIPTLNCAPHPPECPESLGSCSGQFNELANKYVPQEDLQQFKAIQDPHSESRKTDVNATETTMYGMNSNHLSFATKQYLQRYGLVNQMTPQPCDRMEEQPTRPRPMNYTKFFNEPVNQSTDRILDLTALRNQPKLM